MESTICFLQRGKQLLLQVWITENINRRKAIRILLGSDYPQTLFRNKTNYYSGSCSLFLWPLIFLNYKLWLDRFFFKFIFYVEARGRTIGCITNTYPVLVRCQCAILASLDLETRIGRRDCVCFHLVPWRTNTMILRGTSVVLWVSGNDFVASKPYLDRDYRIIIS